MNKLKKSDWIAIAIAGAILLIIALPIGEKENTSAGVNTVIQTKVSEESDAEEYVLRLEEKLEQVLSRMEGVGAVQVMITTGDYEESVLGNETLPAIEGVVVVAEGGGNSMVVSNISKAAMALFPIEAHKIMVVKMNSKGD